MKGKRKLLTVLLVTLLTVMIALPVSAATAYTPVVGDATSCTFKKFLIVGAGDAVPAVTFTYTVAAGAPKAAVPGTSMEVLAGVSPDAVVVSASEFTAGQTSYDAVQTGDVDVARNDRVEAPATQQVSFDTTKNEKYAVATSTVDFSNVRFPEPGIYRYIITEVENTDNAAAGFINDDDTDRVLDVYVVDKEDAAHTLSVAAYVMHKNDAVVNVNAGGDYGSGDVTSAGAALADKTDGFTNEYATKDLAVKKEVAGNQASRDKYFAVTVALTGLAPSREYAVSLAPDSYDYTTDGNADITSGTNSATISDNAGKTNVTTITSDANGAATTTFYLQHGQSIAIRGIPVCAKYTVTENAEDYKSTPAAVTDYTNPVTSGTQTIGEIAENNKAVKTSFLNTRDGVIPTGIILSAGGLIIAAVIALAGVVFFGIRSRKKYEEE